MDITETYQEFAGMEQIFWLVGNKLTDLHLQNWVK